MTDLRSRRIIEALRTGVPTHDAVVALGTGQPKLESAMTDLLRDVRAGTRSLSSGFVFNGSFGSGKSHALEAFAAEATEQNFVVSRVAVSKNLPLHSSLPIFVELLTSLRSKSHADDALLSIMNEALNRGTDLTPFQLWTNNEVRAGRLAPLFSALLSALRKVAPQTDAFDTILEYLSGAAVPQAALNVVIRVHAPHVRDHTAPRAPVRAANTARFLARFFVEIGYSGWIVLFDELELIRLQGPISRGKAYAELASWFALDDDSWIPGFGAVGTVTSDFVDEFISGGTNDMEFIPWKLSGTIANAERVPRAVLGMQFLVDQDVNVCTPPDVRRLNAIQQAIRVEYTAAFGGSPSVLKVTRSAGVSVRAYIRRWITVWDLERQGRTEALADYEVVPALEDANDDEND